GRGESAVIGAIAHVQTAKKVNIAGGDGTAQILVLLKILEIGFHQGMKLLHLGHEEMFTLDRPIDHLIEAAGGGASLSGGSVALGERWFRRSLGERSLVEE